LDRPILSTSVLKVADRSAPSRNTASMPASVDRTRDPSAAEADAGAAMAHAITAARTASPAALELLRLLTQGWLV
jgi:hypothetical protein